jgi:hypothetical protein
MDWGQGHFQDRAGNYENPYRAQTISSEAPDPAFPQP